jgi:hypothetical protein
MRAWTHGEGRGGATGVCLRWGERNADDVLSHAPDTMVTGVTTTGRVSHSKRVVAHQRRMPPWMTEGATTVSRG